MKTINLRNYYYPCYKEDVLVEVSDEVAEALLLMLREETTAAAKSITIRRTSPLTGRTGLKTPRCADLKNHRRIFSWSRRKNGFFC